MKGGGSPPRPGRVTPFKDPVPIVQEAGWAPGPVRVDAKNLVPTGIGFPDRSEALYRLSYPGQRSMIPERYVEKGVTGSCHTCTLAPPCQRRNPKIITKRYSGSTPFRERAAAIFPPRRDGRILGFCGPSSIRVESCHSILVSFQRHSIYHQGLAKQNHYKQEPILGSFKLKAFLSFLLPNKQIN